MASFGEQLRRERELRGITLREIADSTKISVRFLQALEGDRLDVLPGGLFRRAFVRAYARYVGLDAERVVSEFVYAHGVGAESDPVEPTNWSPQLGTVVVVVLVSLLVPALLAKVSWRGSPPVPAMPVAPAPVVERVYATPAPVMTMAMAAQAPGGPGGFELTLSAREDCWVLVRVDGHPALNRVLNEGESETLQARREVILSVGNAGGLDFRVNDRPGVPLGRIGEVRRNIVITHESLPSFVDDTPASPSLQSS